jgi:hypothetical protein
MHVYCLRSIKSEGGRLCRESYSRFLYSLYLHPRLRAYPFTQTKLRRKTFSTVSPLRPKNSLKLSSDNTRLLHLYSPDEVCVRSRKSIHRKPLEVNS